MNQTHHVLWCVLALGCAHPEAAREAQTTTGEEASVQTSEPRQEESMVIRVVVDVKPEQVEAFLAFLAEESQAVRQLPGCQRYELFRDPTQPHRFLLYEEWATPEDFAAYQSSELLQRSFATLGPMMAGPPDSAYFRARLQ